MSVVRSSRWSAPRPPSAPNTRATAGTSLATLRQHGVRPAELFGSRGVAFRAVESVDARGVEVLLGRTVAWLPRSMIEGGVRAGQWLRFTRDGDQVRIAVDLLATLRGESRLADLFTALR